MSKLIAIRLRFLAVFSSVAGALIISAFANNNAFAKQGFEFELANHCPPSFELVDGKCKLHTRYDQYLSIQDKGVGGTRTALPARRDGFSPQQIDLGRYLFFDPILSVDKSLSCASCHQPEKGFADGLALSQGVNEKQTIRSSPSLWNMAFSSAFFWDARASTLEEQAQGPLFAEHEMGHSPEQLLLELRSSDSYRRLFSQAFPEQENESLNLENLYIALAAFQTSLISLNSRYDQYAHGHHAALSQKEIDGLNVFRSFVARCSQCHQPPLFTNQQIAVLGAPDGEEMEFDVGAMGALTHESNTESGTVDYSKLRGGFKIPTLRNIELTAPYMHSGALAGLHETLEFYNQGRQKIEQENPSLQLHWHISEPNLTEAEIDNIVAFLASLTDQSLMPEVPKRVPSGLPVDLSKSELAHSAID